LFSVRTTTLSELAVIWSFISFIEFYTCSASWLKFVRPLIPIRRSSFQLEVPYSNHKVLFPIRISSSQLEGFKKNGHKKKEKSPRHQVHDRTKEPPSFLKLSNWLI
jgi:hypothetical protein